MTVIRERPGRKGRGKVTIAEVALHAGVSSMTVSRVINDGGNVREDKRRRVEQAIAALNYSPNFAARSLASADTVRIGLMYDNPSSAYLGELLLGVLEESSRVGGQVVIARCDGASGQKAAVQKLLLAGVDGVILPPPLCESVSIRKLLDKSGITYVAVASGRTTATALAVGIDDFAAAFAMTQYLAGLGHRRIAFIRGHPNQSASRLRYEGYVAALREASIDPDVQRVEQGYFTYQSGLAAAEAILAGDNRPTAIFASNDDMAAGVCAIAHRLAISVPGALSVAGFDDTPLAMTIYPELTTVRQPIAAMARAAVDLLVDQVHRVRQQLAVEHHDMRMPFELIVRGSTAPHATAE